MKYPCDIIQDLLPLYLDGVCSENSKITIEKHLAECSNCKAYYDSLREDDSVEINTFHANWERQKATSFQAVKKKLLRKQILIVGVFMVTLGLITSTIVGILKTKTQVVENPDNISVSMVDGNLVGRLSGSQQNYVRLKRITYTVNDQEENYLFFYVTDTLWDELTTSSKVFSEYTLCSADKGADQIDAVYYFVDDYTDIESMSNEEIKKIIDASKLLWNK